MVTKHRNMYNSIIDGEHVLYNKSGQFINLYLAFDIYYKNTENFKGFPFVQSEGYNYVDKNIPQDKFRLDELNMFVENLDANCVVLDYETPLTITAKRFYANLDEINYIRLCKIILDGEEECLIMTDGLIFTQRQKCWF